jgi:hypothetical protein
VCKQGIEHLSGARLIEPHPTEHGSTPEAQEMIIVVQDRDVLMEEGLQIMNVQDVRDLFRSEHTG